MLVRENQTYYYRVSPQVAQVAIHKFSFVSVGLGLITSMQFVIRETHVDLTVDILSAVVDPQGEYL